MSENEKKLLEGALTMWEKGARQNISVDLVYIEHTEHTKNCLFKNIHWCLMIKKKGLMIDPHQHFLLIQLM